MSEPTKRLVTIDDPVTIIEPHRVLLEWVEIVHREFFYTGTREGHQIAYRHDAEGTTWARGHHLPESEVVSALRAAASLVGDAAARVGVQEEERTNANEVYKRLLGAGVGLPPLPALPSLGSADTQKLFEEAQKAAEEGMKDAQKSASWWSVFWSKT